MARMARLHWAPPASMVGSFLTGLFLAIGHHLFYASLAGTETPNGTYNIAGKHISLQQLNTAVGTAFGFLVKSFLTVATSIAFAQAFWNAAKSYENGAPLITLDNTYSLLDNLWGIRDRRTWRKFSTPLFLAVIAWCVPIASIITPATLSVQTAPADPPVSAMNKVPNFDFASLDFVAPIPEGSRGFCFNGPSQSVQRVVAAVAAQGRILPIEPPAANTSWTLDFWGPSVKCHDIIGDQRRLIWDNILDRWANVSNCLDAYGYLAWTPASDSIAPFVQSNASENRTILQSGHISYNEPASIFVATIPQMFNFAFMPSLSLTDEKCTFFGSSSLIYTYPIANDLCLPGIPRPECYGQDAWLTDATLLRCDLANTSYSATFNYTGGSQVVTVETGDAGNSSLVTPHECYATNGSSNFPPGDLRCISNGSECYFNAAASKLLSYQGIASAFNELLLGSVTLGGYGSPAAFLSNPDSVKLSKTPGITMNSTVGQTILMDTEDLAFMVNFSGVNETYRSLQTTVNQTNSTAFRGFSDKIATATRGDFKTALETLFQNITISLLSDDHLQPDYTSPYAPPEKVMTTFNNYHNVYAYSERTLWIAYGLAIFFTAVAVGLGIAAMIQNDASYANDFSTVLRCVRSAPMSIEIAGSEHDGRQPLPKHLARSRIVMEDLKTIEPDTSAEGSTVEMRLLSPADNVVEPGSAER